MKKIQAFIFFIILVFTTTGYSGAITDRPIGEQDIKYYDGVTSTFTRDTSTGGKITLDKVGSEVDVLMVYGGGVNYTDAAIVSALTAIGATKQVTIILRPGTWLITDNLAISSNVNFRIAAGALLSIPTTKTLAINGPFEAGLYRVFNCVGTGKVVFGVGSVKEVYPQWFGAYNDGTHATETAAAFNQAIASLPGGGLISVPAGEYQVDHIIDVKSGISIQGACNTDRYYGELTGKERATFIYPGPALGWIFNVGGGVRDISFNRLAMSAVASPTSNTGPSTYASGINFEGGWPHSTYRIEINNVTFYNFYYAISVKMTNIMQAWQCDSFLINHCTFFNNKVGVYFDSINADYWHFATCTFIIPNNGYGVYCKNAGFLLFTNCAVGGKNAGVTNNNYFMYIQLNHDNVTFIGCQAESLQAFLNVGPTAVGLGSYDEALYPISFDGCIFECPNLIQRRTKLVSKNSRYHYNIDVTGDDVLIDSYSDSFSTDSAFTPITPATSDISGTGTLVTVNYTRHGLVDFDWINVGGSSTTGYNVDKTSIIINSADSFSYFATGKGTPTTAPAIRKYARPIRGTVHTFPHAYRMSSGRPINIFTPMHIGDEVFDKTNSIFYKAIGLRTTDWAPIIPFHNRIYNGDPNNHLTPFYVGEEVLDLSNGKWYKSINTLIDGWAGLN